MRFGKIEENEELIKFGVELKHNNCYKKDPEGIKSSKKYFKTIKFNKKL